MIVDVKDLREGTPVIEQGVEMTSEQVLDAAIEGKVSCRAISTKVSNRHYLSIDYRCNVKSECARCTETFTQAVKGNVKVFLQEIDADKDDFDGEVIEYSGNAEAVDLRDVIYEEIMLQGAIMPLCKEDCPGIILEDPEKEENEEHCDPRWEVLRKLKEKIGN